jgi:hypothetical protein
MTTNRMIRTNQKVRETEVVMAQVTDAPRVSAAGNEPLGQSGQRGWEWQRHTAPFSAVGAPDTPARFVVEQIANAKFAVPEGSGFQYNPPGSQHALVVTHATLPDTDFASIPRFMSWFVSRHGRHTPAALVHDMLVTDDMPIADRVQADREFLRMMDCLDVPPVRSRVMWAAVTVATRWKGNALARLGIVLWGLFAAGGVALLARGIVTGAPWQIALALLAPIPASMLWGSQRPAGLIAGLAMPFVVLPALASWLGYGVYWLVEQAVRFARAARPKNDLSQIPQPISFKER